MLVTPTLSQSLQHRAKPQQTHMLHLNAIAFWACVGINDVCFGVATGPGDSWVGFLPRVTDRKSRHVALLWLLHIGERKTPMQQAVRLCFV